MKLAITSTVAMTRRVLRATSASAAAAAATRRTATARPLLLQVSSRSFASAGDRNVDEIEQELHKQHDRVKHSFDSSPRGLDIPQSSAKMEQLHDVYTKIDTLEKELSELKQLVKDNERIYAVDGPDGYSDDELQLEEEEAQKTITQSADLEDKDEIKDKHEKQKKVQEYHARDPEHDW